VWRQRATLFAFSLSRNIPIVRTVWLTFLADLFLASPSYIIDSDELKFQALRRKIGMTTVFLFLKGFLCMDNETDKVQDLIDQLNRLQLKQKDLLARLERAKSNKRAGVHKTRQFAIGDKKVLIRNPKHFQDTRGTITKIGTTGVTITPETGNEQREPKNLEKWLAPMTIRPLPAHQHKGAKPQEEEVAAEEDAAVEEAVETVTAVPEEGTEAEDLSYQLFSVTLTALKVTSFNVTARTSKRSKRRPRRT
jgi:hypothetical protein